MYGQDILCGISKGTFEIPSKISYQFMERYDFYATLKFEKLFYLRSKSSYRLTLYVRGPSYLGLIRSISWLLMPWLLAAPGHQQPWYWLYEICKSWSYTRKDFNYLWQRNDIKCKYMFMFPLKNLAHKGLTAPKSPPSCRVPRQPFAVSREFARCTTMHIYSFIWKGFLWDYLHNIYSYIKGETWFQLLKYFNLFQRFSVQLV